MLISTSPADATDVVGEFQTAGSCEIDEAVGRAREAFPAWRDLGLDARAAMLEAFASIVAAREDELATLIAREVGKALWEARAEAKLIAAKVAGTLGDGMKLVAPMEAGGGARATYHPRGVIAVLGPFNFPAHLPNGHIVPALATGNTVVFKPSEWSPTVGAWMVERWNEAGLPEGVLELVQGGAATGATLGEHDDVDAVLFTGSYAVGRKLQAATLDQPHKLLALELGGKNACVVLDEASMDRAVAETAVSIAATAGQRCSSASRVFVHEACIDAFQEKLCRVLSGLTIGAPLADGVFMGPLIHEASHARVERMRLMARQAGGERVLASEPDLPVPFTGPGLVRFDSTEQKHAYQREELFGPEAALYPIRDLDHAIEAVNDSDYGLVASVFTADRARYEHCIGRVRTGILNWNKGTIGASGKLPFGGEKRSGNDRPAGITATLYCTTPQAHLEDDGQAPFDASTLPPGVPKP